MNEWRVSSSSCDTSPFGLPSAGAASVGLRRIRDAIFAAAPRAFDGGLVSVLTAPEVPARVEQRARWVPDTLSAGDLRLSDDLPYRAEAWEQVERGELPQDD